MRRGGAVPVCALGLAMAASRSTAGDDPPPILVARETTYITSPLTADGLPDYGTWLGARGDAGIALADNAAPPLLETLGIEIDAATRRRLGLPTAPSPGPRFVPSPLAGDRSWAHDRARRGIVEPSSDEIFSRFLAEVPRVESGAWEPEDAPLVAEWLADDEEALDAAAEAAARKGYWWPRWQPGIGADPVPMMAAIVGAGRGLAWRAALRAGTGRGAEAAGDLLASLRIAALAARGGGMLEGLLASAVRTSAIRVAAALAPALHPRDAEILLDGMEALPEFPRTEWLMESERVLQLGRFLEVRRLGLSRGARAWKPYVEWGGAQEAPAGIYEVDPAAVDWNELLRRANRAFEGGENAAASPETDAVEAAIGIYDGGRSGELLMRTQQSFEGAREALRRAAWIDE